jgi:16S rRNA (guanine527-N7)-methyltransferase
MNSDYPLSFFQDELEKLNIKLKDKQFSQFIQYYELLTEWNKVMNLTGIVEWDEVVVKHFIDSLSVVKACDIRKKKNIIDVGTGAGFPGIPLKIAFPECRIVLLDSLKKRVSFLDEVIKVLDLKDIFAVHGRAEDAARQKMYRESFDLCVSRAVASLNILSEYCLPFVRPSGLFISYKSGKVNDEMENSRKAVQTLGGKIKEGIKFNLADQDIERSFVIIEKEKSTPRKYPRKAGLPSREPI